MGIPKAENSNQDFPYLLFVMLLKHEGAEFNSYNSM